VRLVNMRNLQHALYNFQVVHAHLANFGL